MGRLRKMLRLGLIAARHPSERDRMVRVLLILFVGLVVLLSIDWTTSPPQFNPMVLLFGILVAGIIFMARNFRTRVNLCGSCGRTFLLPDAVYCPYCGTRLH